MKKNSPPLSRWGCSLGVMCHASCVMRLLISRVACRMSHVAAGSVVILALWAITLLSIMAAGIASQVFADVRVASRMKWGLKVDNIAWRGFYDSLDLIKEDASVGFDTPQEAWANDEVRFKDIPFGGATYQVFNEQKNVNGETSRRFGLIDEERKINLNKASKETFSKWLQSAGSLNSQAAEKMALFIVDYRDENGVQEGTENTPEDCSFLKPPSQCKNKPFETLEELWWVPDMTSKLFEKIQTDFTVYGSGAVNINSAGVNVLRGLGLSQSGAEKIVEKTSGGSWIFKDPSLISGDTLGWGLSAEDQLALQNAVQKGSLAVRSDVYGAAVEVAFSERHKGLFHFIFNRNGGMKSWREN